MGWRDIPIIGSVGGFVEDCAELGGVVVDDIKNGDHLFADAFCYAVDGHDDAVEKKITANPEIASRIESDLRAAKSVGMENVKSDVAEAIRSLKATKGWDLLEEGGTALAEDTFNELLDQFGSASAELANQIESAVNQIVNYQNTGIASKIFANTCMFCTKFAEGTLGVVEDILDAGLVVIGGTVSLGDYAFGGDGKNVVADFLSDAVKREAVHEFFEDTCGAYDAYEELGSVKRDSAFAGTAELLGEVGAYVVGGELMAAEGAALGKGTTGAKKVVQTVLTNSTYAQTALAAATGIGSGGEKFLQENEDGSMAGALWGGLKQGVVQGGTAFAMGKGMEKLQQVSDKIELGKLADKADDVEKQISELEFQKRYGNLDDAASAKIDAQINKLKGDLGKIQADKVKLETKLDAAKVEADANKELKEANEELSKLEKQRSDIAKQRVQDADGLPTETTAELDARIKNVDSELATKESQLADAKANVEKFKAENVAADEAGVARNPENIKNLNQAEARVAELEGEIGDLRVQKEKLPELRETRATYEKHSADIRDLDAKIEKAQTRVDTAKADVNKIKTAKNDAVVDQYQQKNAKANATSEARQELKDAERELSDLEKQRSDLSKQRAKDVRELSTESSAELDTRIKNVDSELATKESQLADAKANVEKFKAENVAADEAGVARNPENIKNLNQAEARVSELEGEIGDLRVQKEKLPELRETRATYEKHTADIRELDAKIETAKGKVETAKTNLNTAKAGGEEAIAAKQRTEELNDQIKKTKSEISELEKEQGAVQKRLEKAGDFPTESAEKIQSRIDTVDSELAAKQADLKAANSEVEMYKAANESADSLGEARDALTQKNLHAAEERAASLKSDISELNAQKTELSSLKSARETYDYQYGELKRIKTDIASNQGKLSGYQEELAQVKNPTTSGTAVTRDGYKGYETDLDYGSLEYKKLNLSDFEKPTSIKAIGNDLKVAASNTGSALSNANTALKATANVTTPYAARIALNGGVGNEIADTNNIAGVKVNIGNPSISKASIGNTDFINNSGGNNTPSYHSIGNTGTGGNGGIRDNGAGDNGGGNNPEITTPGGGYNPGYNPGTTNPGGGYNPGYNPGTTNPGYNPGTTNPGTTNPGTTKPGTTNPGTTDPGKTNPGTTDPGKTNPGTTDPGTTNPGTTNPGTTNPGTTNPGYNPGGDVYNPANNDNTGSYHTGGGYTGTGGYSSSTSGYSSSTGGSNVVTPNSSKAATSIDDIIKGNKYTKVPTSTTPITPNRQSGNGLGTVIPIAAGLSAAAAAGIGAKAYLDRKKNNDNGEYDEEDDDFSAEEWTGDENTMEVDYDDSSDTNTEQYLDDDDDVEYEAEPEERYGARNNEELADLQ